VPMSAMVEEAATSGSTEPDAAAMELRPSGGDAGSDVGDLRVLQAMLHACGPSFRRIPARMSGASTDFVSTLLIQVALPRPVSLYLPARVRPLRPRRNGISGEVHAPHSKLLEAYSNATLHVLQRQRMRSQKEEALRRVAGLGQSGAQASAAAAASSGTASSNSNASLLPFETVRDQSGLLASLLGVLEYVHSHPVRPELQRHARALMDRLASEQAASVGGGANMRPLPSLFSRRMLLAREGMTSQRILERLQAEDASEGHQMSGKEVVLVRSQLRRSQQAHEERSRRLDSLHSSWMQRDRAMFGKWSPLGSFRERDLRRAALSASVSLEQVPAFVVPPSAYHGLLRYYEGANQFGAALQVYERCRHAHVSLSFDAALALVSLAGKFGNDELLAHFVSTEALPLSRHSAPRRARLWAVLSRSFARFNSYSNVDVYMRYLLDVLTRVLPRDVQLVDGALAPASHTNRAPGIGSDMMDPFPSASGPAGSWATSTSTEMEGMGMEEDEATTTGRDVQASARKRQLDELWQAWASRGGVTEMVQVWSSIRARMAALPLRADGSTSTGASGGVVLDDASVSAVLAGVLHRSPGGDALAADPSLSRSGEEAASDIAELLRHLARFGVPLAPEHVQRIAVDLPLFVAASRVRATSPVQPGSWEADAAEEALWASLQRDSFASEASWAEFCARNGVPPAVRQSALSAASPAEVAATGAAEEGLGASSAATQSVEALRAQLLAAAGADSAAGLFAPPASGASVAAQSQPTTRSSLRARVLALHLRRFNASVGSEGIDRALDYLDAITQQQQKQSPA